jgi:medium-chain acyl-[acyl-carrier-protein] hydrolase
LQQVFSSRALIRYRNEDNQKLRLFCFPYAGGSAATYREWSDALAAHVDLVAIEYPGRGARRRERLLTRITAIVDALLPDITSAINGPFALFGHSMGSLVIYELLRRLLMSGVQPACVVMSGCKPPSVREAGSNLHELPNDEFVEELRKLDGTPEEVLADAELMSIAFPILRADFEAVANYSERGNLALSCPVFAYGGMEDPNVAIEELEYWSEITGASCTIRAFPGNHFFIHTQRQMLLRVVATDMLSAVRHECPPG